MTERKTDFDFEAMRRAIEERDADALIGLYADGVEIRTVNKNSTPSHPSVLRGKAEVSAMIRDVCAREMTHRVEDEVVGEDRVSFNESCEYAGGTKVLSAMALDVRDGKIIRQTSVEAWDE